MLRGRPSGRPRARLPWGLIPLALVVAGCGVLGGGSGPDDAAPGGALGEESLRSSELTYPLDEFDISDRESAVLLRAQAVLTEECMERFAFEYAHPLLADEPDSLPLDRRYGLSDPDYAARYGYGWPAGVQEPGDTAPDPARARQELGLTASVVLLGVQRLDPAAMPDDLASAQAQLAVDPEAEVIEGQRVPYGGCVRESALRLYAPVPGLLDPHWVRGLVVDAYLRAEEEPEVREAVAEWVVCMAEYGYTVSDPVSPVGELGLDEADLSGEEARRAAGRDVGCKQRSGLVGAWYQVERDLQQRVVEEHADELAEFKRQRVERRELAEEILDGDR